MELFKLTLSQACGRTYGLVEVTQTSHGAIHVHSQLAEGGDARYTVHGNNQGRPLDLDKSWWST